MIPIIAKTIMIIQHIFWNFIKNNYFLWFFIISFCVYQFHLTISNVVSRTVNRCLYVIYLFGLDLGQQGQLLYHFYTLMDILLLLKNINTFSSLTMSLHLSIMSDTAFYNCADGALRSFYFSMFWVIYGLWTNSSTCYYVNYCRLIIVACLFIVYLTVNVNFYCASLYSFMTLFAFRVTSAHMIALEVSPFYFCFA